MRENPIQFIVRAAARTWTALVAVLLFWAIAAKGFNAYLLYPWLDMPTHFAGGFTIARFFHAAIEESASLIGETPRSMRLIASVALTALAAVGWEFLEFLSDRFLGSHLNLGVSDTLSDLFFGISGGMTAAAVLWIRSNRSR